MPTPIEPVQPELQQDRRTLSVAGLEVLVIDDDPDFREVMTALLDVRGAHTSVAPSGRKGLARVRGRDPDVVLLDQWMPDMNGVEVAERMRARGDRAAIVLVSAAAETRALARRAPIEACLIKPFSLDDLIATVSQAVARRRADLGQQEPQRWPGGS